MRDLVVAKLSSESAVLPETRQVTLIFVKAALGLVVQVVLSAEHTIEIDACPANIQIVTQVAIFVQLRSIQIRMEWKVGPAVHVAPKGAETKFDRASLGLG